MYASSDFSNNRQSGKCKIIQSKPNKVLVKKIDGIKNLDRNDSYEWDLLQNPFRWIEILSYSLKPGLLLDFHGLYAGLLLSMCSSHGQSLALYAFESTLYAREAFLINSFQCNGSYHNAFKVWVYIVVKMSLVSSLVYSSCFIKLHIIDQANTACPKQYFVR